MSSLPSPSFGALLRRYRQAAGLTQEALAERARLSRDAIDSLERGVRRTPRKVTVALLAEALALPPRDRVALEAAVRWGSLVAPARSAPSAFLLAPRGPFWPLVGRAREVALLARHLAGEGPPVLLLAGEPGIGKSRLLREARQRAAGMGWTVLEGGCQRRRGQEPYAPLVGALSEYVRAASRTQFDAALDGCTWLVRLLPELAETAPPSAPAWTLSPEQERRLMFTAVGRFLANVAGPTGTLLILDDLQWAGADALDLLVTLVRSASAASVRVIGAYRTTELRPEEPLSGILAELADAGLVAQQRLGPLAPSEAKELLTQVLGSGENPGAERIEQLLSRTGGVPFFLVSCAEALRSGTLASAEEAVPWTVAQSIRQRVAALSKEAQNLLGVAAIIGRQMERPVLVAVMAHPGQAEGVLVSALEEIGQAHLLVEAGEEAYQFPHDLIREVVLADLSAARRASLHRRVAEALEQMPGEPATERLVHHYARAGVTEKAVFYLERAGDRAWAVFANAEAEGYFRELLARLATLGRPLDEARAAEKLGNVLRIQGCHGQALAINQQAADAYQRGGDSESHWRMAVKTAWVYWRRGMYAEGLAYLHPRVEAAGSSIHLREFPRVLALLAIFELNTGRYHQALATAARAVQLARATGEAAVLITPGFTLGRALLEVGRTEEALHITEEALPLAEREGDLTDLAGLLMVPAACYLLRGEFAKSQGYRERAVEFAERIGDPSIMAHNLSTRGRLHFLSGDWRAARADAERAVALYRQIGGAGAAPQPLLLLGELFLAQGRWEEARSLLEEGLTCAERMGQPERLVLAQSLFAEWELLKGHPQAAWTRLEPLLDPPDREAVFLTQLWTLLAWAAVDLGDEAQAEVLLEQALQRARTQQLRFALVDPLRIQARLSTQQECWAEAQAALKEALALCRAMSYPYAQAKALHVYGWLHIQKGEPEQAHKRLKEALAICARLGERLYVEQVEQALTRLAAS